MAPVDHRTLASHWDFPLRVTEAGTPTVFGPNAQRASIKSTTKADGEFQRASPGRIREQLIAPAVRDLRTASDGQVVDVQPVVPEGAGGGKFICRY